MRVIHGDALADIGSACVAGRVFKHRFITFLIVEWILVSTRALELVLLPSIQKFDRLVCLQVVNCIESLLFIAVAIISCFGID